MLFFLRKNVITDSSSANNVLQTLNSLIPLLFCPYTGVGPEFDRCWLSSAHFQLHHVFGRWPVTHHLLHSTLILLSITCLFYCLLLLTAMSGSLSTQLLFRRSCSEGALKSFPNNYQQLSTHLAQAAWVIYFSPDLCLSIYQHLILSAIL